MTDTATIAPAWTPARIDPPPQPLRGLRWLRTVVANPIETWPAAVYREPLVIWEVAGRQVAFVMAPDLVRQVLLEDGDAFEKGELTRRSLRPALGDSILTAESAQWRWQRRAAAPAFRPDVITAQVPAMRAAAERMLAAWHALPDGAEIDVAPAMMRTTLDVILDSMLGGRDSVDADGLGQAVTDYLGSMGWITAMTLLRIPAWMPFPGRRRAERGRVYLRKVAMAAARQARAVEDAGSLPAALAGATDPSTGRGMSDQDLADNLLTFMTAGHETTALALTWTFYLLSRAPAVEQRVREEVAAVAGGAPLQAEHVDALVYTRQVLQESIRLYPPAPAIARTAIRDVNLGGRIIAPGTTVYVPVYAIHRHAQLWDMPDRFDPERFRPDLAQARDRYAYMPFGAGPRICIGMAFALTEAVVIIATLLRAYRLDLRPGYEPRLRLKLTLRPAAGMPMRLYRR